MATMTPPVIAPRRKAKRQRVDATIRLLVEDDGLRRDEVILRNLLNLARDNLVRGPRSTPLKNLPTLYSSYRGSGFPLRDSNGRKIPIWRNLSPWMKTQIAALCLAEAPFVQIRLHLHDEISAVQGTEEAKVYLRDRLMRCLRERFDPVPWFYVVIEDRDAAGDVEVRPHVHGAIEVPRLPFPLTRQGRPRAKFRRAEAVHGLQWAEQLCGRIAIDAVLRQASGNAGNRPPIYGGRDQRQNVWKRKPFRDYFSSETFLHIFRHRNTKLPIGRARAFLEIAVQQNLVSSIALIVALRCSTAGRLARKSAKFRPAQQTIIC